MLQQTLLAVPLSRCLRLPSCGTVGQGQVFLAKESFYKSLANRKNTIDKAEDPIAQRKLPK